MGASWLHEKVATVLSWTALCCTVGYGSTGSCPIQPGEEVVRSKGQEERAGRKKGREGPDPLAIIKYHTVQFRAGSSAAPRPCSHNPADPCGTGLYPKDTLDREGIGRAGPHSG